MAYTSSLPHRQLRKANHTPVKTNAGFTAAQAAQKSLVCRIAHRSHFGVHCRTGSSAHFSCRSAYAGEVILVFFALQGSLPHRQLSKS